MQKKHHCLNCNEPISKNFCPNCGQKTDTHKITIKHFIFHDIAHGVWHFEKGILFTLKEALIRPGQAALDYIGGKRVRYYNVFYLSLLMIGLQVLLIHFYDKFRDLAPKSSEQSSVIDMSKFFIENIKIILFSIVPLLGLNAILVFRRLQLNLAEHLILAGITLLGMIELSVLFSFVNFLSEKISFFVIGVFEVVIFFGIILFPIWSYHNAIKNKYTFLGKTWRLLVFYLIVFLQIIIIMSILITQLTDGEKGFYIDL
jgi:Protein of unknown function (DUF3667)